MNNMLFLFDVDGTLAESGQELSISIKSRLHNLMLKGVHIGIVGGGKLDKILQQIGKGLQFQHYFTECGCVYHKMNVDNTKIVLEQVYCKNIREHVLYPSINILIKEALFFLSQVKYMLTGNFIDLRNGIIYISLIGMSANTDERKQFLELDNEYNYKLQLIDLLHQKAREINIFSDIEIVEGGSVGIAIYPKEYNKTQVVSSVIDKYKQIHFFGDKYRINGNDYNLIYHPSIIGHCVDSPNDTLKGIDKFLNNTHISNLSLRNKVYDNDILEQNIGQFSLWTILRTQILTVDFCAKYLLSDETAQITQENVLTYQPHISKEELLVAIRKYSPSNIKN